jgi:hypothetical protein
VPRDPDSEARQLAAGQIGISWLPDDLWSRGKCGLKILQYQAAGLPVIANPVGCQSEMIRSGETGILASTPQEWADAVKLLAGEPELRRRMGNAGRRRVDTDYSLSAWAETLVSSMTGSSQPLAGSKWKVDRSNSESGRALFEPHTAPTQSLRTLKAIGER